MTYSVQFTIPAGTRVKHPDSGIEGIVAARIERINGNLQYCVVKYDKEGIRKENWWDAEDLQILDKEFVENPPVEFKFQTGDKVKNLIHCKTGIVSVRKQDKNGCISYWYETGDVSPETGAILEFFGFEQEFELVDAGLNKKNIDRKRTGSMNITSSGKR